MYNCPELVDREGCTNIGFSWMIQISQVLQVPVNCIGSVTPESEIPRWFNNLHEGNCVSLDASTVMHDDSWFVLPPFWFFKLPRVLFLKIKGS